MLRFTSLVVSLASGSLAAVANFCGQQPYNVMLGFNDYEPAKAYCAPHFPAQTITKTLSPRCLTTTSTVILGTSTVTTTSSSPCSTRDPLERQEVAQVERRAEPEAHWWEGETWWLDYYSSDKHPHRAIHCESSKQCPDGVHCWNDRRRWWHDDDDHWWHGGEKNWWHDGEPYWQQWAHLGQCVPGHWKRNPNLTPPKPPHKYAHPPPEESSGAPMPTHNVAKRTPVGHVKRDAMATKSAEWVDYRANLVQCGYDCIQTACSCIAATKVEYRTPVPSCTETKTKETILRVTATVTSLSKGCEHEDLRRDSLPQ